MCCLYEYEWKQYCLNQEAHDSMPDTWLLQTKVDEFMCRVAFRYNTIFICTYVVNVTLWSPQSETIDCILSVSSVLNIVWTLVSATAAFLEFMLGLVYGYS